MLDQRTLANCGQRIDTISQGGASQRKEGGCCSWQGILDLLTVVNKHMDKDTCRANPAHIARQLGVLWAIFGCMDESLPAHFKAVGLFLLRLGASSWGIQTPPGVITWWLSCRQCWWRRITLFPVCARKRPYCLFRGEQLTVGLHTGRQETSRRMVTQDGEIEGEKWVSYCF